MTYQQVSKLTAIPVGTLYCYVHRGLIPHFRVGKRLVRFKREEVMTWLENGRVKVGEK